MIWFFSLSLIINHSCQIQFWLGVNSHTTGIETSTCQHVITGPRDCHWQPWGFPGQPAPVPAENCTRSQGCGLLRVWVWVSVTTMGAIVTSLWLYVTNLSFSSTLNNNHYTTTFSANEHQHGLNVSNDHLRQQELLQKAKKRWCRGS